MLLRVSLYKRCEIMFGSYNDKNEIVFSDEEDSSMRTADSQPLEGGSWQNFTLRFGKYKGTTLDTMIQKGRTRQYLRYILKWPDIRPNTADNINQALAHYNMMKDARAVAGDLPALSPSSPPKLTREYSHA